MGKDTINEISGGSSRIADPPSFSDGNGNVTATQILTASATTSNIRTLFFGVFVIYILLILLYILQSRISILVGWCFRRRRKMAFPQHHADSPPRKHSYHRRLPFYCSQAIFAIRLFIFDYTEHRNGRLDGSDYQSWTVSQATRWAYSQLQNQYQRGPDNNGGRMRTQIVHEGVDVRPIHSLSNIHSHESNFYEDREDEFEQQRALRSAVAAMKKQRIDGKALEFLTLDHLLGFGIAFGVAVHLMTCLDELIPNRFASDEEQGRGELPSWYESGGVSGNNRDGRNFEVATNAYKISDGEQDMAMTEKAQTIMKERFGMALPELRGQNNVSGHGNDEEIQSNLRDRKQQYSTEKLPPSSLMSNNDKQYEDNSVDARSDNSSLNETGANWPSPPIGGNTSVNELLNSMPPHIRAIAERQPDLVSELLQQKQQLTRSQTPSTCLSTVSEEDGYRSEEEINIDQESVSLLRRRIIKGDDIISS